MNRLGNDRSEVQVSNTGTGVEALQHADKVLICHVSECLLKEYSCRSYSILILDSDSVEYPNMNIQIQYQILEASIGQAVCDPSLHRASTSFQFIHSERYYSITAYAIGIHTVRQWDNETSFHGAKNCHVTEFMSEPCVRMF